MPQRTVRKKRSRRDFMWFCIFVIVVCGIIIARQEYKIYQVNKELEATNQRVEELKKDKAELEAEKKRLDDLKYIEKLAREIVDDKENGAEQKNKDAESKNR